MHRITRRIGDLSARRPWITIVSWMVAALVLIGLAVTAHGTFVDDYTAPGSRSEKALHLLKDRFPQAAGGSAKAVFAVPAGQRLAAHRPAVDAALARIARAEHVTAVADPFRAGTVSADGRIGYADITFDLPSTALGPKPIAAVTHAMTPVRDDGVTAELGGDAAFINYKANTSGGEAIGILAALVILVIAFGTVVAAMVPILLALATVAIGVSGIALLAGVMNVASAGPTVAAVIGLGVGIDYALFIVARYRQNRSTGSGNATALSDAMSSAGSSVVFAGGVVVLAMLALQLTGLGFIASVGLGTAFVVLLAVASALTLLPALLTLLGDRVDAGRILRRRRHRPVRQAGWWRFAHHVARRPWPYLIGAAAVLFLLATPALGMHTGYPDAGDDSTSTSHRRAYDLLAEGFGPGANAPLLFVADLRAPGVDAAGIPALSRSLAASPGIAAVGTPQISPAGDTVVLAATPTTSPRDTATARTLARIRHRLPGNVAVSGVTAMTDDLTNQLDRTLPVFIGATLVASFLLLMLVFRSIAVPVKACLMNLLSVGGAYGVVVAVFQWGWGKELLGLHQTYRIASPLPVVFFAILFGLSMDYEVFLLSRIREEYRATGDSTESIARGLAATGRVITSAALIMTVVFLGFVTNPSPLVRMLGLGLSTAIVLDATVVRLLLVPAIMSLMGRANWWLPRWLDRRLPIGR